MKFGIRGQLTDLITCVKFLVDRFRGYGVLTPQNCHLPLTCCVALTTMYALPCDTVIVSSVYIVFQSLESAVHFVLKRIFYVHVAPVGE